MVVLAIVVGVSFADIRINLHSSAVTPRKQKLEPKCRIYYKECVVDKLYCNSCTKFCFIAESSLNMCLYYELKIKYFGYHRVVTWQ